MSDIDEWTQDIHQGDALDLLDGLPAESIHAVVTDPPYGLAFMGQDWDDFESKEYQEWCERWSRKARRVLKPGGHLLAFSGNRTHHRLFSGVEDAGYEIRDTLTWHYGSGFPKAADVSKVIDERADAEREVVSTREADDVTGGNYGQGDSTDDAKTWDGWKTGLKPATEFVVMARKPFDGATVDCVLEHGVGSLNIDGCRVGDEPAERGTRVDHGRYPSTVVFGEREAERLDAEVGTLESGAIPAGKYGAAEGSVFGEYDAEDNKDRIEYSEGGPSRYFYTSKATRAERTMDGKIDNNHPTVKPQDLMEWLVKLVTREEQIVLDPFAGTGTTCAAAKTLGRKFIGIEQQAEYVSIAQARAGVTVDEPELLLDEEETPLAAFGEGGDLHTE